MDEKWTQNINDSGLVLWKVFKGAWSEIFKGTYGLQV